MLRASRQREVDSKSNEITAVPELLDTLHLDAMGCQKDDTLPEPCIPTVVFAPKPGRSYCRFPLRVTDAGSGEA